MECGDGEEMAFETEQGNVTKVDAAISALAAPAFVESSKALAHCAVDTFADNNATKRYSQEGKFEAGTLAESAAYTFDADDEYTETHTDVTAQTYAHIWKPTVQAERFSADRLAPGKMSALQGEALARAVDSTWLALFSGLSTVVTAASTLTKDDLLDAQYTVHSALKRDDRLHVVIDRKGRNEIRKELTSISADAFSRGENLRLVEGGIQPNGLVGEFVDMFVFNTSGLPTDTGDDVGAVFHPDYAWALPIDQTIRTRSVFKGSDGLVTEVASWLFANVIEWIDAAGVQLRSDT